MNRFCLGLFLAAAAAATLWAGDLKLNDQAEFSASPHLKVKSVRVTWDRELESLVFEIEVEGRAGGIRPRSLGQLDGAPVLAYVFPTTLQPGDIGFVGGEGTVALVATSHPDFDDTPLWDENGDRVYDNDGAVYHTHWVLLTEDRRVPGGLAVRQFKEGDEGVVLPPTNPGMPLFLDSPGFPVLLKDGRLRVPVPVGRVAGRSDFRFDAATAYLQVNQSVEGLPMLGVYKVYSVASGDLSLPYQVSGR